MQESNNHTSQDSPPDPINQTNPKTFNMLISQIIPDNKKSEIHTSNKELMNKDEWINTHINTMQNSIIKFCRNKLELQRNENFFKMEFTKQFEFNECITNSSNKVKDDFDQIELFYLKCKNSCIENDPEVESNLFNYINNSHKLTKPSLHPCVEDCRLLFFGMHESYKKYFIKGMILSL